MRGHQSRIFGDFSHRVGSRRLSGRRALGKRTYERIQIQGQEKDEWSVNLFVGERSSVTDTPVCVAHLWQ